MIKTVKLENFKSIRHADLQLNRLNILVGPNGSGKSNFISLFRMLEK
jgi:predicted ATPase